MTLLDIDDLQRARRAVAHSSAARRSARFATSSPTSSIVIASRGRHARWRRSSPRSARAGRSVRHVELERHRAKLAALDPTARDLVDAITQGIVNKLLHEPTVRVKDAAGTARGELYADALAELFDLPETHADDHE